MLNLYNKNGLIFWSEEEIRIRNMVVTHMVAAVERSLLKMNTAFKMVQCEAPTLTPFNLISKSYSPEDYYALGTKEQAIEEEAIINDDCPRPFLVLRPETTMGSYAYARHILSGYHKPKFRLPMCVWQHGKSFRKEQDQPTKNMRLKEFYQLEFQILYSATTANDYYDQIVMDVKEALQELLTFIKSPQVGACHIYPSDRLPEYSEQTTDIIFTDVLTKLLTGMEICSISRRKDYDDGIKNVEVAIGTDRCVYNYLKRRENETDESEREIESKV